MRFHSSQASAGALLSFASLAATQSTTTSSAESLATAAINAFSSGCGGKSFKAGDQEDRNVQSNGTQRSYIVHVPASYDSSKNYPVVLGFHGHPETADLFEADTQLDDKKWSGDKIMVYPDGIGESWGGANYSKSTVPQDLQFMDDLLDDMTAGFCVDDKRFYATGLSMGGGWVNSLACDKDTGGRFAAFAAGSGAFYTDNKGPNDGCSPARVPTPMLEIHGGDDHTIPYDGGIGSGGDLPSIPNWLSWWVERDQCKNKTEQTTFNGDVHHYSWTCAGKQGTLQHWKVDDMDHCWASTEPNLSQLGVNQGPTHIEANDIIMKFFDQFSKP